ncbi:protein SSUH2 homolog isoform X1 [Garra rufa]|uniref:protein SSUH2 homolog isoform X1 n=2 Tax=Garra rufa TaxID=137080 RepID=UPI003CCEDF66
MERPIVSDYGTNYGTVNPVYGLPAPAMAAAPASSIHGPSAPPANMFDTVPGYEGTLAGGGGGYLPPPMPSAPMPVPEQAPSSPAWNIPCISEDRAREAFSMYVSSKCCYSSGPVKEGVITNMEPFNTYRYRLETFMESRSTEWSHEPYSGQAVDAGVQPAPGPWQIGAQAPAFFQDHKQTIKVPYTSSVKNCHTCLGMGRNPCTTCAGAGNKPCWVCNGSGYRQSDNRCMTCNGRGRENCSSCSGNGSCQCKTCHGKRQLLVFINLTVKWSTGKDDFIAQDLSGLRVEKLGNVTGKELFKDAQYMVYPVRGFPDVSVAQASERLVGDHQVKYAQTSRILQQRQTIELIPITKVNYMWKGKPYVYYVYGNEFQVNTDDYPATCCCSVM